MYRQSAFPLCCGMTMTTVLEKPVPLTRNGLGSYLSGHLITFTDPDVEAAWVPYLRRRKYTLHKSGVFWFKSMFKSWDIEEIKPAEKNPDMIFPRHQSGLRVTEFKEWTETNYQYYHSGKPISVLMGFPTNKYCLTWNKSPLAEFQILDSAESRKYESQHVLADLANNQIASYHDDLLSLGFEPVMAYINRLHYSRNVLYYKENK